MFVFRRDAVKEDLGEGITREVLAYGDEMMAVTVSFKAGATGVLHHHPHTQLTYVLEGAFKFTIGDETKVVRCGDTLYKPSGVWHGCVCLEDGRLLDVFNPPREDFIQSETTR